MRYRGSYLMAFGWLLPILAEANPAIELEPLIDIRSSKLRFSRPSRRSP